MLKVKIKTFKYTKKEVLHNIQFNLDQGERLAILGESGCGKSTLLHLIYGLLDLEHGTIYWNGSELKGPKNNLVPGDPNMKLLAQEFNLMPFTSVLENVSEHLNRRDLEEDRIRVMDLLKVVGLTNYKDEKIKNLSGGQKQRVALAKALAVKPLLLLLDEPFSNIDNCRKNELRRNLYSYLKKHNISSITATHDAEEALSFSNSLLILKDGKMEAFGETKFVYNNVSNVYQANFFGEVNQIPIHLVNADSRSKKLKIIYAHNLIVSETKSQFAVTVEEQYFKGSHYLIKADYKGQSVYFYHPSSLKKDTVFLKLKND